MSETSGIRVNLSAVEQVRTTARFYFGHYVANQAYFQIFWAIENQSVIGELPSTVLDQVARLWEQCIQIVAELIENGIKQGEFRECDSWEVAHLLWTIANGLIQTEHSATRRRLRRTGLDEAFDDALELVLRGLRVS